MSVSAKPATIAIPDGKGGEVPYDAQLFHIATLDEAGLPKLCERIPHGAVVDLDAGRYAIFYIPRDLLVVMPFGRSKRKWLCGN